MRVGFWGQLQALRRGGRRQAEKTGGGIRLKINIHADFELRSFFYEKTPPKAL